MNLFKTKELKSINPNILITNYCNQSCSFCFANKLMTKDSAKEMSLKNYISLLEYLKRSKINKVYLMGGEPTLHSNFKELFNVTIKKGFGVEIFTNARFTKEVEKFLLKNCQDISMIHINVGTPAYRIASTAKQINNFIRKASDKTVISLETTVASMNQAVFLSIFSRAKEVLPFCSVRIGVDGALVSSKGFSLDRNKRIGKIVMKAIDLLINREVKGLWLSEMNACMFDENQINFITDSENITLSGYGCLSKRAGIDIKTDLKVIRCFGLNPLDGYSLVDKRHKFNKNLTRIKKKLDHQMEQKTKKTLPIECLTCKYYGFGEGQCPGPCLVGRQ